MSATEQTCDPSKYRRHQDGKVSTHQWERSGKFNPHGTCWIFDFKCHLCGAKKHIAIDPSEPFNDAVYWEARE